MRVSCALGAFSVTRGKAWFDQLAVVKLGTAAEKNKSTFAQRLFPGERARIVQLLVESVEVAPDGLDLRIRTDGLQSLVAEIAGAEERQAG